MRSSNNGCIHVQASLDEFLGHCSAFDLLESAVAIIDSRHCIAYQNPAFQLFNTRARNSISALDKDVTLIDSPDMQQWLTQALLTKQAVDQRQVLYYAIRIQVELTLRAQPILSTQGDTLGLMLTIADESVNFDRQHIARAQETHRTLVERIKTLDSKNTHNDNLVRILLKESPVALVLMNDKREIIQSNRAAERIFGVPGNQLIGRTCDSIIDCYSRCKNCPAATSATGIEAEELFGISAQQERIPLMRNVVVVDRNTTPVIIEAIIDLSEHKKDQESIQRLSEFNRLLVESTGEGIFSVDRDLCITFANQAAADMLGYTTQELLGQDAHALLHWKDDDGAPLAKESLPISDAIRLNRSTEASEVFWNKSGHAIPVQYTCSPLHDINTVAGAVIVYRNVTEARAIAKKLDYLATHDLLTGQLNRHAFDQRLSEMLERVHDRDEPGVLCYVDLDQFKIINDTCGHAAGDELLRQLSELIHKNLRVTDTLARLGGDEFGILLHDSPLTTVEGIIESILHGIAEYRFGWEDKAFSIGASIGVVELDRSIGNTGTAMSAADSACYVAKERGRNRMHVYTPNDQDLNQRQLEIQWVNRIRSALNEGRLMLMAQSISPVNDARDHYRHMELLLRLYDDDGQLMNPGAFITAAERYGFMSQVDMWVVRETLKILARHRNLIEEIDYCCINLSGQSVTDDKFLEYLSEQFSAQPDLARRICLEITETAAVTNLSRATQFMQRLKKFGVAFALDDFGSGMSSFAYLKNLPVDFLKIDGNFVRDMSYDRVDYAMVEAIHRVGNVMNLKTIAEFVEDDIILDHLRQIGVNYAQGYGIHKPEPFEAVLMKIAALPDEAVAYHHGNE